MADRLRIAVVGLGFGRSFVPIYAAHPDVAEVGICDLDPARLASVGDAFGVPEARRHARAEDVVASAAYDAVHLATPIGLHAAQAIAALEAGKHCAVAVPAATSLEDLHAVVRARRRSGRVYMMMETAVFSRECLLARSLVERGELGRLQLLRGAHHQSMEGWPSYWRGLPPMHYATHAVGPVLDLAGGRALSVTCLGSGTMAEELHAPYGNPYPIETALLRIEGSAAIAEVTRSLFATAHPYEESFSVYGERASLEWPQWGTHETGQVLYRMDAPEPGVRGQRVHADRLIAPDRADLLPPEIAPFTRAHDYRPPGGRPSLRFGGGHGGSHPHLVHEFVRSIVEGRPSRVDAPVAADWTAVGLCAHESAMQEGAPVPVPAFGKV